MSEKKSNNLLIIILVILLLGAVGVIFYLLGSNSVKENDNNNENQTEEKENNIIGEENTMTPVDYSPKCSDSQTQQKNLLVDIEANEYNNISEYIQAQKNVKIKLNYCNDNPSTDDIEIDGYELTDSEKNSVLNEMKNSSFNIAESGLGGVCVSSLEISYERNNKEYYVLYYQLFAMSSNDGNIYKILDKSTTNTLSQPQYCIYNFNNLSSTANSILNRLESN